MRRRITMGLLALGVVGGFGLEFHRMKACGGACPDEQKASFAAAATDTQVAPQAAAPTNKNDHKKGEHCNGWKMRWNQDNQQPQTPEATVTTAQK